MKKQERITVYYNVPSINNRINPIEIRKKKAKDKDYLAKKAAKDHYWKDCFQCLDNWVVHQPKEIYLFWDKEGLKPLGQNKVKMVVRPCFIIHDDDAPQRGC